MSDLISAIVPTVQKDLNILLKLLNLLKRDPAVGEIIVINNGAKNLPQNFYIEKVKMFKTRKNLYVNGSWNFGIANSIYDTFLIINDDILPVENFCSKIINSNILDRESTGLVGIDISCILTFNPQDMEIPLCEKEELSFSELPNHVNTGDWGSAFFGKKENYYNIPDELKIIYGDNYLLFKNLENEKINYKISGIRFHHVHSLSCGASEFEQTVCQDIDNAVKYHPRLY